MALTLTAAVIADLLNASTHVIELVRWDMGNSIVKYLSNRAVVDPVTFDGRTYRETILQGGIPKLDFPVGRDSGRSKVTIRFANHDGYFDDLRDNQGVIFRGSKLSIVRGFPLLTKPNNRIGDWGADDTSGAPNSDGPYWFGRCLSLKTAPDIATGVFRFGGFGINQRAYREFSSSCWKVFKGPGCPYGVIAGRGHPKSTSTGTSTGITATTLTDTGATFITDGILATDFVLAYQSGDLTKFAVGTIQSRTETVLTIDAWAFQTPAAGWEYIAGPEFTSCDQLHPSCIQRGMYGYKAFNKSQRRFHGGVGPIALTPFDVVSRGSGGTKRYRTTPEGNDGIDGTTIPVPVGTVTLHKLPIIAAGADADFIYSWVVFGEGRCSKITKTLIDGVPIDNHDFEDPTHRDPQQYGGFEDMGSADDSAAVTAGEITEDHRVECFGTREVYAKTVRLTRDEYKNTPYLFSSGDNANGPSNDGLSFAYIRVEPPGGALGKLFGNASMSGVGVLCKKIPTGTTHFPSVPEFIWTLIQNKKWGAKQDVSFMDSASFTTAHDHVNATAVKGAAPKLETINTTVLFGPLDADSDVHLDAQNWVFIERWAFSVTNDPMIYIGAELEVTQAGKTGFYTITNVWTESEHDGDVFNPDLGGHFPTPPGVYTGKEGAFFQVTPDFPNGKIPAAGDTITLRENPNDPLHGAAGNPAKSVDIHEAISDLMANVFGDHYQKGGKFHIAIRKSVNLATVDTLPTITDKGTSRNVLARGKGKSFWNPGDASKMPNELKFSFTDRAAGFERRTFTIKNELAQNLYVDRYGDDALDEAKANLDLNLTSSLEEAIKVAALWLRHFGARPAQFENGTIQVDMPLHDAVALRPIEDVRKVDLTGVPSWVTYARVDSMKESITGGFMTVTMIPYVAADYTDPVNGLTLEYPGSGPLAEELLPKQVKPETITEEILVDDITGLPQTVLIGEYTLPGSDV